MIIVQLSDLHVRPYGKPCNRVNESNMLTERAFRAVARMQPKPDAILITGDLTDCGLVEEYAELQKLLAHYFDGKVFVIPGNHDRRENFIAALKPPVAPTGFVDYAVDLGPVRLVMLDTLLPGKSAGELRPEQLQWLDETLAQAPATPTMIAMHHPPFLASILHMDKITLQNADAFRDVIARHAQVDRIICGHYHRQITARVGNALATIAPSTGVQVAFDLHPQAASAFVKEPGQYVVHVWTPESGFVSHTVYVEDFEGPYPFVLDAEYPGES
ncbi:phosphodiesterase [Methylovirgula sp. 4M-Z18]|uniref:phosphodiesterase n=1 Tax=Methylovirgula sp. 4M-Z18 TaxID=2293567 RepID=UPI000E2EC665|nr:phosphodiesterase [Methylovirgula sp. 4M-Z18]RFB78821.1 phosphodiesterase [Methylovirgula sp. 4M-Z18]